MKAETSKGSLTTGFLTALLPHRHPPTLDTKNFIFDIRISSPNLFPDSRLFPSPYPNWLLNVSLPGSQRLPEVRDLLTKLNPGSLPLSPLWNSVSASHSFLSGCHPAFPVYQESWESGNCSLFYFQLHATQTPPPHSCPHQRWLCDPDLKSVVMPRVCHANRTQAGPPAELCSGTLERWGLFPSEFLEAKDHVNLLLLVPISLL